MKAVEVFAKELSKSPFLVEYFGGMTPADARIVERYHHDVHGVAGMIGSLDCLHFVWGNCPVAHHGQYQKPTLVVEAMADDSLYVWHAVFGYCGTLSEDGSFEQLDFSFSVGGESFDKLWMLVNGIYSPLSRFVKPISVPIGDVEALLSMW